MLKHGDSRKRIYRIYVGIKQRCRNENCSIYYKYGGRGIDICSEWFNDYFQFRSWALDNGYSDDLTIDRKDNSKGYSPDNCRWVDYVIQNTNLSKLKTNTSGYTGVSWAKDDKRWVCVISIENKSKRIGGYKTQKDALEARNKFIDDNNLPHKKSVYIGELFEPKIMKPEQQSML